MQIDFFEMVQKMAACWNVNATLISLKKNNNIPVFDLGLRGLVLENEQESLRSLLTFMPPDKDFNKAYEVLDCFDLGYFFLWLPHKYHEKGNLLLVGPYRHRVKGEAELYRMCMALNFPKALWHVVSDFFKNLPIITAMDPWHMFLGNIYSMLYPNNPMPFQSMKAYHLNRLSGIPLKQPRDITEPRGFLKRFLLEQDMIDAISRGDKDTALKLLRWSYNYIDDSNADIEQQFLRAIEYWSWGATIGGVYAKVLENKNRYFTNCISTIDTKQEQNALYEQMLTEYCDLVGRYSYYSTSSLIRDVLIEIDENIAGEISLQKLAKKYNVNTSYLSSRFKHEIGLSLMEYVLAERLRFAKQRFEAGCTSIQETAEQCGIYDLGYFRRCFKKETGMSPSEYIAKIK